MAPADAVATFAWISAVAAVVILLWALVGIVEEMWIETRAEEDRRCE